MLIAVCAALSWIFFCIVFFVYIFISCYIFPSFVMFFSFHFSSVLIVRLSCGYWKLSGFSLSSSLSLLDTWNSERVIVLYLRVYKLPFKSLVLMSTVCLLFFVNRFCFFFVRSTKSTLNCRRWRHVAQWFRIDFLRTKFYCSKAAWIVKKREKLNQDNLLRNQYRSFQSDLYTFSLENVYIIYTTF